MPYNVRTREQIAGFYEGLELVEPGVIPNQERRSKLNEVGASFDVAEFGGVGLKI